MRKRCSSIITLLIGILLGTAVGMLFSPIEGTKTRSLLLYQLRKLVQKVKRLFIYLIHFHSKVTTDNNGKLASQEVINRTIRKAKKLLEEAKTLSDQLEG
jgi:gas vesicle protein